MADEPTPPAAESRALRFDTVPLLACGYSFGADIALGRLRTVILDPRSSFNLN